MEFFVRHFDFVLPSIEHGFELEDRFVVEQLLALPVQADKRKEPVLDLVPLTGAGRLATNRDRYRKSDPPSAADKPSTHGAVAALRVGTDQLAPNDRIGCAPSSFHRCRILSTANSTVSFVTPPLPASRFLAPPTTPY